MLSTLVQMGKTDPYICPAIALLAMNTFLLCTGSFLLGLGLHELHRGQTDTLASFLAHSQRTHQHAEDASLKLNALAVICTCVGGWLTLLGSLGVSGTLSGTLCLLMLYVNLATLTLFVALAVGAAAYFWMDAVVSGVTLGVKFGLYAQYGSDLDSPVEVNWFTNVVDRVQTELGCCGLNNYSDFAEYAVNWEAATAITIPVSCCKPTAEPHNASRGEPLCPGDPTPNNSYISSPCGSKVSDWLYKEKDSLYRAWMGVVLFLLVVIGFSLLLICF